MQTGRNILTPEALDTIRVIARTGSFAAAARELGKAPSALTYSVRHIEDALDVLLFDRHQRKARLTAAGETLLSEGVRILDAIDAVASRVKRVATGWEAELTIAVDAIIDIGIVFELCEQFLDDHARKHGNTSSATQLRIRAECLAGTWETLVMGRGDLAIGVPHSVTAPPEIRMEPLGSIRFVHVVAPGHPLALQEPRLGAKDVINYRMITVGDTSINEAPWTFNLPPEQQVLSVPTMAHKLDFILRGVGCGFMPEHLVKEHLRAGRLVLLNVDQPPPVFHGAYAWHDRSKNARHPGPSSIGPAMQWWLARLKSEVTRRSLLGPACI